MRPAETAWLRRTGRHVSALFPLVLLAGCASVSAGRTGPVTWQAVEARVRGDSQTAIYTCTLVVRETAGRDITFTRVTRTASWGWRENDRVPLQLPAYGEVRLPISWRGVCRGTNCSAQKGGLIFWDVLMIGTDADGRPVRINFEFMPPTAEYVGSDPGTPTER